MDIGAGLSADAREDKLFIDGTKCDRFWLNGEGEGCVGQDELNIKFVGPVEVADQALSEGDAEYLPKADGTREVVSSFSCIDLLALNGSKSLTFRPHYSLGAQTDCTYIPCRVEE